MLELCCITDLIRFMMKEAEKMTKESVHEDDFFIVYDTLVLMTAEEKITWTKEENYFHWLVVDHEWIAGRDTLCWEPCR